MYLALWLSATARRRAVGEQAWRSGCGAGDWEGRSRAVDVRKNQAGVHSAGLDAVKSPFRVSRVKAGHVPFRSPTTPYFGAAQRLCRPGGLNYICLRNDFGALVPTESGRTRSSQHQQARRRQCPRDQAPRIHCQRTDLAHQTRAGRRRWSGSHRDARSHALRARSDAAPRYTSWTDAQHSWLESKPAIHQCRDTVRIATTSTADRVR